MSLAFVQTLVGQDQAAAYRQAAEAYRAAAAKLSADQPNRRQYYLSMATYHECLAAQLGSGGGSCQEPTEPADLAAEAGGVGTGSSPGNSPDRSAGTYAMPGIGAQGQAITEAIGSLGEGIAQGMRQRYASENEAREAMIEATERLGDEHKAWARSIRDSQKASLTRLSNYQESLGDPPEKPLDLQQLDKNDRGAYQQAHKACLNGTDDATTARNCAIAGTLARRAGQRALSERLFQRGCADVQDAGCVELAQILATTGQSALARALLLSYDCSDAEGPRCTRAYESWFGSEAETNGQELNGARESQLCEPQECADIGKRYETGSGVIQDPKRALEYYGEGCRLHAVTSCALLGGFLIAHGTTEEAYAEAITLLQPACDSGNAGACSDLGVAYGTGHGVPKNQGQATALYVKACAMDNVIACQNAGTHYFNGDGVVKDRSEAIVLFRKAVALRSDSPNTQNSLAWYLALNGQFEEALPHAEKAVELGPDRSYIHDTMGYVLAGLHQFKRAAEFYANAARLEEDTETREAYRKKSELVESGHLPVEE